MPPGALPTHLETQSTFFNTSLPNTMDTTSHIKPIYTPSPTNKEEPPSIQSLINSLNLQPHLEGGYYKETHRDTHQVPNPFQTSTDGARTRCASSTILYLLTPQAPLGAFHRNQAGAIHTWRHGRGRYVVIHADGVSSEGGTRRERAKARVESFFVGPDATRGERQQWVVDGGKYKASLLLPDSTGAEGGSSQGLLISEVSRCHCMDR